MEISRSIRSSAFAFLFVVLGACGGEEPAKAPEPQAEAPAAAPAPEPAPAPALEEAPAPEEAPAAEAPEPAPAETAAAGDLQGDAEKGAQLYATFCATCHGATGKGDGPAGKALNPPATDHTNHDYMATLSDEHLFTVISKGGAAVGKSPLMTPWGGVIDEQGIRNLIAHLRKLSNS